MSPIFAPPATQQPFRSDYGGQIQGSSGAIVMAGLPSLTCLPLPEGDAGTEATIAWIRQLVDQGVKDPLINRTAIDVVRNAGVPQFDFAGEPRAITNWVIRNIRFMRDIAGKETLRSAREILTVRAGDCDDINAILIPSLLGTIGHKLRLVTISAHPGAPQVFSHIYAECFVRGRWVALDAARKDAAFGKAPARYFRKRVWSLTSSDYAEVSGLGYYAAAPGLGFNWAGFADVLTKGSQAATGVISSWRYPKVQVSPNGQYLPGAEDPYVYSKPASQIPSWLLPAAGIGVAALLLLGRRS